MFGRLGLKPEWFSVSFTQTLEKHINWHQVQLEYFLLFDFSDMFSIFFICWVSLPAHMTGRSIIIHLFIKRFLRCSDFLQTTHQWKNNWARRVMSEEVVQVNCGVLVYTLVCKKSLNWTSDRATHWATGKNTRHVIRLLKNVWVIKIIKKVCFNCLCSVNTDGYNRCFLPSLYLLSTKAHHTEMSLMF